MSRYLSIISLFNFLKTMMNLKIGDTVLVTILSLGKNGEGVAEYEGKPLYIDNALPHEIVKAKIIECRKNYSRAQLIEIVQVSENRSIPECSLFGRCGGCQLMHLNYSSQLELKQQKVQSAFQQFSLQANVAPCLPSPASLRYRNKIQLPVEITEHGLQIGLYAKASHELVDVNTCLVHCSLGESIFHNVKQILQTSPNENIRHVLIKTSIHLQEVLVTLVANNDNVDIFNGIAIAIMECSPYVKGVMLNINETDSNVILGSETHLLKGNAYITEKLGDLLFHISPASFFQVNTLQAEAIYAKALELSNLNGDEIVLDAFCGVGTISLFFANHVKKVIGVECVPEAIVDANKNAHMNGIHNAEFHTALAENFIQNLSSIDVLVLNPPRKGCAINLLNAIKRLMPPKIIYISCDPETLARDLSYLATIGYKVKIVQPYDMFPQTTHVETVVFLQL